MLGTLRSFLRSSKGNVAMIFAISLLPLIYLTGMGVDYGSAAMREAQLNAIADSASLAAVTPSMMDQLDSASITAATNYFNAQASALTGVNSPTPTVTVADTITTRTVTVTYTATSSDFFPNVLGRSAIPLSGSSTAVGSVAPNIDFYLMLDDSPSMALPATSAGIAQMEGLTQQECDPGPFGGAHCGCAFACHESHPAGESYCNKSSCSNPGTGNPSGEDNYTLAVNNGITLRIDNLRTAVENLTTTATATAQNYSAHYRMAVYTFDACTSGPPKCLNAITTSGLTASMSTVSSDAQSIQLLEVYQNNELSSGTSNSDEDTDWDGAMDSMNNTLPAPGNGTNATGDTPQEVLFIVTDGMVDEAQPSTTLAGSRSGSMSSSYGTVESGRQQSTVNPLNSGQGEYYNTDWCAKVKARGIRIAIIYTQYLPLVAQPSPSLYQGDGWYLDFLSTEPGILPMQCSGNAQADCTSQTDNVGLQLQACASPGLYQAVTTDGDISAALNALFQEVVVTAHLLK
jgi:Flp pilus assembly protein TadG